MNIVFLTLAQIDVNSRSIYSDLVRYFRDQGHNMYIVQPFERRIHRATELVRTDGVNILGVKTLNIQKTNLVEKGLSTLSIEYLFRHAISKYLHGTHFDCVLYSTPPITFAKVIRAIKANNKQAFSYLLLKDIFPQNAVDLGMMSTNSILYKWFRHKEKELYAISDYIGCMSQANIAYIVSHNPQLDPSRIELAPNSIQLVPEVSYDRKKILHALGLPYDKKILLYGGNLGKPQGVDFIVKCLESSINRTDCHFVIVGNGTEYKKLENWCFQHKNANVTLLNRLPKHEFDELAHACDIGLIFLDYRFTIPNFPSRLLSYLENKMPVLIACDKATDIGIMATNNKFGVCCCSNDVQSFTKALNDLMTLDLKELGTNGYNFLCKNYLVQHTYNAIIQHV